MLAQPGAPEAAAGETASGVFLMTLEDEAGMVNAVVWRDIADRQRRVMMESQLMCIHGKVERRTGFRTSLRSGWRTGMPCSTA